MTEVRLINFSITSNSRDYSCFSYNNFLFCGEHFYYIIISKTMHTKLLVWFKFTKIHTVRLQRIKYCNYSLDSGTLYVKL